MAGLPPLPPAAGLRPPEGWAGAGAREEVRRLQEALGEAQRRAGEAEARARAAEGRAGDAEGALGREREAAGAAGAAGAAARAGEQEAREALTRLRSEHAALARSREGMAQALQKAQQGRLELEDERAHLEEECATLQRSLAEGAGGPGALEGGREEFLLQQFEEERDRGRRFEAELAASRGSGGEIAHSDENGELDGVHIRLAEAEAARADLKHELRKVLEERTIAIDQREDMVEALDTLRRQLAEIRRSAPQTPERSVVAPPSTRSAAAASPPPSVDLEALREKASGLERSRQILLSEVEEQNLEMERLFAENSQLMRSEKEAREFAEDWEQQAGAAQQASERLQEMLEEQSQWQPPEANGAPATNGAGLKEQAHLRETPAGDSWEASHRLREAEARNAALEVQMGQLNAGASRAQEAYSKLARAIGPVLDGVEQRIAHIRREQYLRQQQQHAQ